MVSLRPADGGARYLGNSSVVNKHMFHIMGVLLLQVMDATTREQQKLRAVLWESSRASRKLVMGRPTS